MILVTISKVPSSDISFFSRSFCTATNLSITSAVNLVDSDVALTERDPPLKPPVILRLQLLLRSVPGEGRRARGLEREDHLRDVQRLVRFVLQENAHVSLVAHSAIGVHLQFEI